MLPEDIQIKGAREHNLQDVSLILPRNRLICFTGVSGSGKSSLAFDTLYAEGQRRYVESLSSHARHFLGQMAKPDVDFISGLSPSISIAQKTTSHNPRSTVGTITEIYDFLRVLYARVGTGFCPQCGKKITAQTRQQILTRIQALPEGTKILILAPRIRGQKGEYKDLFYDLMKQGFVRARVDGKVVHLAEDLNLDRQMRHFIEVVIDRLTISQESRGRLSEAVETALRVGNNSLIVVPDEAEGSVSTRRGKLSAGSFPEMVLSSEYACPECQLNFEPPSPQLFSFNSPQGMCQECDGLGEVYTFDPKKIIPDDRKSFQKNCIELIPSWNDLGRWRRVIYKGMAEYLERTYDLSSGSVLQTPWRDLPKKVREKILYGTGSAHITFTWRAGPNGQKWGGTYEGVIPMLLSQYRSTNSRIMKRRLEKYMDVCRCGFCGGERLNPQARAIKIGSYGFTESEITWWSLPDLCAHPISEVIQFFTRPVLEPTLAYVAEDVLKEIRGRLGFLEDVGLEYLALSRTAPTLSGGEMQRIRLAGQVGCGLVGVLYILDEPSIGLHPRDNNRLLGTLEQLRDLGNTVVVVEHDEDTMLAADEIIDFGPGAGIHGGKVVAKGNVEDVLKAKQSVTGQFLSGRRKIPVPETLRKGTGKSLVIRGASHNNLKNIDVEFPLGKFICMTGVSGSGKSSLVNGILKQLLNRELNHGLGTPGEFSSVEGLEYLNKMIAIDQSPIGRTPRSNPATYIKLFDEIRSMYAELPDARQRGFKPGRFSFNVDGGRCDACQGNGANKLEMDFLADVWVTCPVCEGKRFNHETLKVLFKGYSISDVLNMDVEQACDVFQNIPKIYQKLETLRKVGLGYMKLGQSSTTLSGGEAQRIKLAREMVKISTGKTFYILDEPTTGLHFADIELLLRVLHQFADAGNTVLVVEHNLDVIKTADWVIDLGPEGGNGGGKIVTQGTPGEVAQIPESYTGVALKKVLCRDEDIQKRIEETRAAVELRKYLGKNPGARDTVNVSKKAGKMEILSGKRRGVQQKENEKFEELKGEKGAEKREVFDKTAKNKKMMPGSHHIHVEGACQHNLKDLTVDVLRDKITVCCGPSGSGKSSFAMDTVYAEGQRRYVESLSSYTRQFIGQMQKPKVERIEGLSPAIAIEQKRASNSPRSTVGTITEIYDYLRILFARLGEPYCPDCHQKIGTQTTDEIINRVMNYPSGTRLILLAPKQILSGQKYETLWKELRQSGYLRVRIDGEIYDLEDVPDMDRRRRHEVEVIVDRVEIRSDRNSRSRIAESVEQALAIGAGTLRVLEVDVQRPETFWNVQTHSQHFVCESCGRSFEPLTPANFSFNSVLGWCPTCEGLGVQMGANPAILLRDVKLSLREGAILLWPGENNSLAYEMMQVFCREMEIPMDVPYEHLASRYRRILQRGTGERWFTVSSDGKKKKFGEFKFQFKGLMSVVEEASRMVPTLRSRLDSFLADAPCPECGGSRLRDDAAAVRVHGRTLDEICEMSLDAALDFFKRWKPTSAEQKIAGELIREVRNRLQFLMDVGLEYLTLGRSAPTLSGGEMQRIRLTAQVGSGLCGVLYVLDEPTIGLHPRDNKKLISALHRLRDLGNTLLVVEHDKEVIASADQVLDFGPKAGHWGGEIVGEGTPKQLQKEKKSVTGPYLAGKKGIPIPLNRRMEPVLAKKQELSRKAGRKMQVSAQAGQEWLEIVGARENNLKDIHVRIPVGTLTAVAGVSGSGKSTLVDDILYAALARQLHRAGRKPGAYATIRGIQFINKVIEVDQQPIGQTPSSNPATYTGVFDHIRDLYAQLPESKLRGFTARRFSFNVPGGRCEKCEGNGELKIEMHFLPDVWVTCDSCGGQRYDAETLAVRFHGYSIADVLNLTCAEAMMLFQNVPKIRHILKTLCDVGLDYITLGQSATTLSGGEAQRVKLAAELSRPDTGKTLYILDEPTTGLHFDDLRKLLDVLNRLVDLGNTVLVIEHNTDVLKVADWMIELGPEAGENGGYVVTAGTPEDVVMYAQLAAEDMEKKSRRRKKKVDGTESVMWRSYTGEILGPVLEAGPYEIREIYDSEKDQKESREEEPSENDLIISMDAKMPWETDGLRWHTQGRASSALKDYKKGGGKKVPRSDVLSDVPVPVFTPAKWDVRILEEVIRRVEAEDALEIDWNDRNMVRIHGSKKSLGWFLDIRTCDEWLLKLNLRVAKKTFDPKTLVEQLNLKPLNEMTELPLYGTVPRVRVVDDRGAFQEIELKVHYWEEVNRPEFWAFFDQAVDGFFKLIQNMEEDPDEFKPWKKLGRKWHEQARGTLTTGKREWNVGVLQNLVSMIEHVAPDAEWGWTNKVIVPVTPAGDKTYWARILTKKPDAVYLEIRCPKNAFPQGRIAPYGFQPECDGRQKNCDWLKFQFRTEKELQKDGFRDFLEEVFQKRNA
ncbi:MAG: excinuclease ABC subunit UvrA [Planctomycetia bacterium]|nr:excinuclease ABC subunit UvrA [Planctomycetia bacterium]